MLWWFCKNVTNQDERKCKCMYENLFDNAWSLESYVCSDSWIALMLILNVLRSYSTAYYCITVVPILYCTVLYCTRDYTYTPTVEKGTNCTVRSSWPSLILLGDYTQSIYVGLSKYCCDYRKRALCCRSGVFFMSPIPTNLAEIARRLRIKACHLKKSHEP